MVVSSYVYIHTFRPSTRSYSSFGTFNGPPILGILSVGEKVVLEHLQRGDAHGHYFAHDQEMFPCAKCTYIDTIQVLFFGCISKSPTSIKNITGKYKKCIGLVFWFTSYLMRQGGRFLALWGKCPRFVLVKSRIDTRFVIIDLKNHLK